MPGLAQTDCRRAAGLEALWKDFFKDSVKWSACTPTERGVIEPDYGVKIRKDPLWMDRHRHHHRYRHPPRVEQKPAAPESGLDVSAGATDASVASLVWACCKKKDLLNGIRLHEEIWKRGFEEILYSDALITLYASCSRLGKAKELLDRHGSSNVVPWTALIAGYVRKGQGCRALGCFEQLRDTGIPLNGVTYLCSLKACAVSKALEKGKQIHDEISRLGLLEQSKTLGNAVVDMYAKCGALPQAQNVLEKLPFRNVITWSALITGYAQHGLGHRALDCFEQMQQEGISPDVVTYVSIVNACAVIGSFEKGKKVHEEISRRGLLDDSVILGNALVHMYAKCGALRRAQSVLEKLPSRNAASWSALIAGYAQQGQGRQALECCEQMQREGIEPDVVTYISFVNACAVAGAIEKGKQVHDEILRKRLLMHSAVLGGALVDMYAKCGALLQAHTVLEKLPTRTVVSWNALITGYAQEGYSVQGLECCQQMQGEGIFPDEVTLLCLLNLCNHIGLVEKGQELFDNMGITYGLRPHGECFTSMVDLLGRAGQLISAVDLILDMPFSPNTAVWHCLWRCSLKTGRYECM